VVGTPKPKEKKESVHYLSEMIVVQHFNLLYFV
jgi:hypothetical protein